MAGASHQSDDKRQLWLLRDILLHDDREDIESLRQALNNPDFLRQRVGPIIEEQMNLWKKHFPKEFQQAVDNIFEEKIKASQEEIINLLYPKLGVLIRKFIANEIQALRDSIEKQMQRSVFARLKSRITSRRAADAAIVNAANADTDITSVFVIDRLSGLTLLSAGANVIDQEVLAAMLTAIKMFMEDAFDRSAEEVELIEYSHYQIHIHNFPGFYIAAVVAGVLGANQRNTLTGNMLEFARQFSQINTKRIATSELALFYDKLEQLFFHSKIPQAHAQ